MIILPSEQEAVNTYLLLSWVPSVAFNWLNIKQNNSYKNTASLLIGVEAYIIDLSSLRRDALCVLEHDTPSHDAWLLHLYAPVSMLKIYELLKFTQF